MPVKRIESLRPVSIAHTRPGTTVVDFGQNINGWVRLTKLGPRGARLTLTHGEALAPDGTVTMDHLRAFDFVSHEFLPAGQVDEVVSAGRLGDVFEPRHTTHGFQFVQLEGADGWGSRLTADDIAAVVVHSDLARVGSFTCSHDSLNTLHDAVVRSFRGNACDIPTDCPQRERSGFTGDWQVFVEAAALIYDVDAFSRKWLNDLAADQWPNGLVPTITPNPAGDGPSGNPFEDMMSGSAGWGDAAALVPWELWRAYGDLELLRRQFPSMRAWVDYAANAAAAARHPNRAAQRPEPEQYEEFLLDTGFHFGEWLEPGVAPHPDPAVDHGIVATAFLQRSSWVVAHVSALLGEADAEARYARIAEGALAAWRGEYVLPGGRLQEESQAHYVRGLAFGLFPEHARAGAAARLAELIRANGGRLATGFLSTGQLLPALADNGQLQAAYELLLAHGYPTWLGMLDNGANTIWEWWDAIGEGHETRGSLNHYSKGAVLSFLYTHIAGIRLPAMPDASSAAGRSLLIAPRPGGGLTSARASVRFLVGTVEVEWRLDGERFTLDVTLPEGCLAEILLPNGERLPGEAGRRSHTARLSPAHPAAHAARATSVA